LGWLSDAGRRINRAVINAGRDPVKTLTSFQNHRIGGLPVAAGEKYIDSMTPKPPPAPKPNTALAALRAEMTDDAKKFRQNIEGYTAGRVQGLLPSLQDAASEGTRRTRENFSRRGLLYSGMAQKGEAESTGAVKSEYARAVAGINAEAQKIATSKEKAAAAIGLEQMQNLMNQAEQYYNISSENDIARRRAIGNLAGGVGYGVGAYYGANQNQGLLSSPPNQSQFSVQPTSYGSLLGVNYGGG
jgi:hypothetical protein